MSNKFTHTVQPVRELLSSLDQDGPFCVRFFILSKEQTQVVLEGTLDWQDGLAIFHSEHIEPNDWFELSEAIRLAMIEARNLIGPRWNFEEIV